jgi:hypothetical protein
MIIKERSQSPPGLIIQGLDNQAFHLDSPNFSNSVDDSPDQTVDRIKLEWNTTTLPLYFHGLGITVRPTGDFF